VTGKVEIKRNKETGVKPIGNCYNSIGCCERDSEENGRRS